MYKCVHDLLSPTQDAVAVLSASYGQGTGPILLAGLDCNGTEESLFLCPMSHSSLYFSFYCPDHTTDAGVVCDGKT